MTKLDLETIILFVFIAVIAILFTIFVLVVNYNIIISGQYELFILGQILALFTYILFMIAKGKLKYVGEKKYAKQN